MGIIRLVPAIVRGLAAGGWFGFAALLMTAGCARAAASYPELDEQMVDLWDTGQGLPQGTVNAIAQTEDGYLWVATDGGLACFDGVRFQASIRATPRR